MKLNIPDGPSNMTCPFHRKSMAKVCKTCPLWVNVTMKDPQTGADLNDWQCAFTWAPVLAIKMSRDVISAASEIEALRKEVKTSHDENVAIGAIAVQRATTAVRETFTKTLVDFLPERNTKLLESN